VFSTAEQRTIQGPANTSVRGVRKACTKPAAEKTASTAARMQGDLATLDSQDAEPVVGQQQAAQRLALEDGLTGGGQAGKLLLETGDCIRVRRLGCSDLCP